MSYSAPLKEMLFVLQDVAGVDEVASIPGFEDYGYETAAAVLEESAKFCNEVVAPLNRDGEVSEFLCLPVSDVLWRLRQHEFTPDAACATAVALT